MYGGKICVKKSIMLAYSWKEIYHFFLSFTLYLRALFSGTSPWGACIRRDHLTEGFLHYRFGELMFGGAYFRDFTVFFQNSSRSIQVSRLQYPICINCCSEFWNLFAK